MDFGWALISGGVSLVVATIVAVTATRRERLRTELRTEFMVEVAIRALLSVDKWPLRSFEKVRRHVAGFEDPELRRLLVRSGALRFKARDGSECGACGSETSTDWSVRRPAPMSAARPSSRTSPDLSCVGG
jgi:hypothetical protein